MRLFLMAMILSSPALTFSSEMPKTRKISLTQVDYRRRLTVGIKVPFLAGLKIRPSIEYRYKPRKNK